MNKEQADQLYVALDNSARTLVKAIKELSPNAKVLVLIEDEENSIICHSDPMIMTDLMGILMVSFTRCQMLEAQSFRNRQITVTKEPTPINKGKVN